SIDPKDPAYKGVNVKKPADVYYNGKSQQQKPVVTDKDGNVLTEGTDYELSYSKDTVNVGEVTVTVTGKGNYTGSVEVTYNIKKIKITVTDTKTVTYNESEQTLEITGDKATGQVEGETVTVTGAVIKGTLVGEYTTVESYEWSVEKADGKDSTGNYEIEVTGKLTITDKDIDDSLVVNKSHKADTDDTSEFELGDKVEFTISVKNIYNEEKTVTITEKEGVKISEPSANDAYVLENGKAVVKLGAGEEIEIPATYIITSDDILEGTFKNDVTVDFDGSQEYGDDDTIETEDVDATLTVEKTSDVADGVLVKAGDVINYTITVKNAGNVPYKNVVVDDELEDAKIADGRGYSVDDSGNAVITELAVGEEVVITATYTVTEADMLVGEINNVATAKGDDIEDPKNPDTPKTPEGEGNVTDPVEEDAPSISVIKEVTNKAAAANGRFAVGETIKYRITVTNNGNVTARDITVEDELTGLVESGFTLAPGEYKVFTTSYKVTEADVVAGKVVNVATAGGTDPEGKPVEDDGNTESNTVVAKGHLRITKRTTSTPANGRAYVTGETITYSIKATNDGNLTLTNVKVIDELTGDKWTVKSLAPGESKTFTTEYVVKARDAETGRVVNVATGIADDPTDKDPTVVPGDTTDKAVPAPAPQRPTIPGIIQTIIDNTIGGDDNDNPVDVTPTENIDDPETPLINVDDEACCILHFLITLITLIIVGFFTRSMKKRQERINEIREQLDSECAKRGLPVPGEE
ncbi:MAG: hypothetical protein PUJ11_06855, partial [Eubacteriaceae bacterium]|nr:hypothetical protein [Eubacteriaceae bacterium]